MTHPWGEAPALSGSDYSVAELDSVGDALFVLDQRLLPEDERYLRLHDVEGAAGAIRDMAVRGAPAIGVTAAYAMTLAAGALREADAGAYTAGMKRAAALLEATRPTAVNLAWAVRRCLALVERHADDAGGARHAQLAQEARTIHRQDVLACIEMGRIGLGPLGGAKRLLTHCNAGALATGGYGTALGVVRAAHARGGVRVYASETRPYLQGARLTAWELARDGIDVTVVTDNMVAHCMRRDLIDCVVVGADRIAANGDVANKIGTYGVACLARQHGIPMLVVAPWSTVDLATPTGAEIPIEERPASELALVAGRRVVPAGVGIYNPAFDVTPAELVTAIVTERGAVAAADIATLAGS